MSLQNGVIYIVYCKSYYENIIYDKLEGNQITEMCPGGEGGGGGGASEVTSYQENFEN